MLICRTDAQHKLLKNEKWRPLFSVFVNLITNLLRKKNASTQPIYSGINT